MGDLLELADEAEKWGVELLRQAMSSDPRNYGYGFNADKAAMAKDFLECAAALRSHYMSREG